jgi:hypothetical protein
MIHPSRNHYFHIPYVESKKQQYYKQRYKNISKTLCDDDMTERTEERNTHEDDIKGEDNIFA